jgi:hypothetical protein
MTGVSGTIIPAADYNSIQSTIGSVMGAASQGSTYGFGQTLTSSPITTGTVIRATHWQNLYTDIARAYTHIYGSAPSASILPSEVIGGVIRASDINLFASAATTCSTNRLTVAASNLTITAPTSGTTITRASTWGSGSTGITAVASFTWASEAAAAAFFNTGGSITMALAHPSTTTTQNTDWNTFLSGFGTFTFGGSGCSKGGGTGTMSSLPYSSYLTGGSAVMNAVAMTYTSYTANYITVTVTKITNGMSITVLLEDNHTNSYSDSVASGTNAAFGWSKATDTGNLPAAIAAPTFTITTNF